MAEIVDSTLKTGEVVVPMSGVTAPSEGSVGLKDQVPGKAVTVSEAANASGGIAAGNFIEPDLDHELFKFNSDDTPLMNLMLTAKKVKVNSPEVEHYMIDEPKSSVFTTAKVSKASAFQATLPLAAADQDLLQPYGTIIAKGVNGYTADGKTATPGKDLELFITGRDATTNNPIVRAVNGPKTNTTDEYCTIPEIPVGTECVILSNALYETQTEVDPDLIVPQPTLVYLQKRGMNQVVSDYFDAQKKHIPFTKALIAEQAIKNFKVKGNRTLWIGRKGKFKVKAEHKMGMQFTYFTEGLRWQFKRELQHTGKWSIEEVIALSKMFYTGEDVPDTGIILCGKNFLENIQCVDYSKHPEISISTVTLNPVGWKVTQLTTVFGNLVFKREPALDRMGYSNSAAIIGNNRIVHYEYSNEHSFDKSVDGEEARRSGILVWDAIALKGSCHIWIDGEGGTTSAGTTSLVLWDSDTAPAGSDLVDGRVYYLLQDCTLGTSKGLSGEMWQYTAGDGTGIWAEYKGNIYV